MKNIILLLGFLLYVPFSSAFCLVEFEDYPKTGGVFFSEGKGLNQKIFINVETVQSIRFNYLTENSITFLYGYVTSVSIPKTKRNVELVNRLLSGDGICKTNKS